MPARRMCFRRCTRRFPTALRRSRGVEGRLVGLRQRELPRDDPALRVCRHVDAARRLSPGLALLGRAVVRGARATATAPWPGIGGSIADYRNSYYGREATRAIQRLTAAARGRRRCVAATRAGTRGRGPGAAPPQRARSSAALLAAGLWRRRDRGGPQGATSTTGNTPMLDATIAYALNRKGELRPAITAMRRAYPQFMADGGERLPRDILKRHLSGGALGTDSALRRTSGASIRTWWRRSWRRSRPFRPTSVSSANAWGLMQIAAVDGTSVRAEGRRPWDSRRLGVDRSGRERAASARPISRT